MRRVSTPQSATTYPLNRILSTEGNVRLLRVLVSNPGPMRLSDLARRAGLTVMGARLAVHRLEPTGIVRIHGRSAGGLVEFRSEHPLAEGLSALYSAEESYFENIIDDLQSAVQGLSPPPAAAWIHSPIALGTDRPGDSLVVALLADSASAEETAAQLARALEPFERSMDVTVEVRALTRADLAVLSRTERKELLNAVSLLGPPPSVFVEKAPARRPAGRIGSRRHADLDARGLAFGRAVAEVIKRDPSLIERAQKWIDKRAQKASAGERQELEEWQSLLRTASPARLRRVLTDTGERSTRLRQTLPFLHALTKAQRDEILDAAKSGRRKGKREK